MQKIFSFLTLAAALLCSGNAGAADVAKIGEKGYETLPAAFAAATDGCTITVTAGEIDLGTSGSSAVAAGTSGKKASLAVPANVNITLDMNGKTVKADGSDDHYMFYVPSTSSLTVIGGGIIDYSASGNDGHMFRYEGEVTVNPGSADLTVKIGYTYGQGTSGKIHFQGGKYNKRKLIGFYNSNDYEFVYEDGLYVIKALTEICTVDGKPYKTIAAAMTAAKVGGVITHPIVLTADASCASPVTENYTFDGIFTLTLTANVSNGTYNCPVNVKALINGGTYNNAVSTTAQLNGGTYNHTINVNQFIVKGTFNEAVTTTRGISGGTFNKSATAGTYISGGTFNAEATAGTEIYGGTFSAKATAGTCVSGGLFSVNPADSIKVGYCKVANAGATKWIVTDTAKVKDGKIIAGAFSKYYGVSEFAETTSHTVLTQNASKDYVVLTSDTKGGKLFRAVYDYTMPTEILADGYMCLNVYGAPTDSTEFDKYFIGQHIIRDGCYITNGTFDYNPLDYVDKCVDTNIYDVVGPTEGLYTVQIKESALVAKIGEAGFPSLQKAITAATAGQTVTLEKDLTDDTNLIYGNFKAVTLDLNGHSISTSSAGAKALQLVQFTRPITIKNSKTTGGISANTADGYALYVGGDEYDCSADVIIESGTFTGKYAVYLEGYATYYKAKVTINGGTVNGTFYSQTNSDSTQYNGLLILNGGTFNVNPLSFHINSDNNDYPDSDWMVVGRPADAGWVHFPKGTKVSQQGDQWVVTQNEATCTVAVNKTASEGGTVTLSEADSVNESSSLEVTGGRRLVVHFTVDDGYDFESLYTINDEGTKMDIVYDKDYTKEYTFFALEDAKVVLKCTARGPVCRNTRTGDEYTCIRAAVSKAGANDTIKVFKSFTQGSDEEWANDSNIIIDLQGYTITQTGNYNVKLSGNLTVKNGTVISGNGYGIETEDYQPDPQKPGVASNIVLDNLTMSGTGVGVYQMTNLVMRNMHINTTCAFAVYADRMQGASNIRIVSGEYLTSKSGSVGIGNACEHKVYIEGGSFNKKVEYYYGDSKKDYTFPTTAKIAISGGQFAVAPAGDSLLVSGFTAVASGDATYPWKVQQAGSRPAVTRGNIGTICLPADVPAGDYSGAAFYKIAYQDNGTVYFDEVENLEAGHAYVFEPTATGDITYRMSGKVVDAPIAVNGLIGTFDGINTGKNPSDNTLTGFYIVNSNKIRLCGDGCSLKANRAYIDMDRVPDKNDAPASVPGRRRISLNCEQASTPTEIMNVNTNVNANGKFILDGQFVIIRDGKMFNAQGAQL